MTPEHGTSQIGIERYMEIRSAFSPSYSRDGSALYFLSTITGFPQVWSTSGSAPWPKQLTFFPDRVMHVSACPGADVLCINADLGGSENAQLYLCDGMGLHLTNLSNDPSHIHAFGHWSADGRYFTYTTNQRNGRHFDVWIYDRETSSARPLHTSDHTNYAGAFSPDGRHVIVSRHYTNLNNDLFLVDVASGELRLLTSHEGEALFESPRFAPGGDTLYLRSARDSEFVRVASLTLSTGAWHWLTPDQWDAETLAVSPDGAHLAFSLNENGTSHLYIVPIGGAEGATIDEAWSGLPAGVIMDATWAPSGHSLAVTLSSPLYATEIWQIDIDSRNVHRLTYASVSGVPQDTFVAPELVHYPSFDGLSIPAWYYRPSDSDGPWPVVVYVHGGPESQSRNAFNSVIQYFVHQGFAVLVPNVRGSSGYGLTYVHLDDVRKRMDSVADLAHCVDWLTGPGNAKPEAIAVMGGSYGGFMVLAAVTHYPHLWAAGVDIVGIANLRTFMENTSPYRRHLRECEYGTIAADGDFFDEISPIHHVDNITAPMVVIHGANDPRVPIDEAEQMVAALQARQHPVDYLRFDDEGHGVIKLANRIVAYGRIASFLKTYLN